MPERRRPPPIGVYPTPERAMPQPAPRDQMSDANTDGSEESFTDKRQREHLESETHVSAESLARRHEVQGVDIRALVWFSVGLLAAMVVIGAVLWWLLGRWVNQPLPATLQLAPALVTPPSAPGPGVDVAAIADRPHRIAPALARISTYGWVDQANGVVHIPIERAMELLVEQGLEARTGVSLTLGVYPPAALDSSGGLESGGAGDQQ